MRSAILNGNDRMVDADGPVIENRVLAKDWWQSFWSRPPRLPCGVERLARILEKRKCQRNLLAGLDLDSASTDSSARRVMRPTSTIPLAFITFVVCPYVDMRVS